MIETRGNLFNEPCDAFCITTNGFIKKDGTCVMGRGCAKQAARLWPSLPSILGSAINNAGNVVSNIATSAVDGKAILSFPVKPIYVVFDGNNCVKHMMNKFSIGEIVPGWAAVADVELIKKSAMQLLAITHSYKWSKVVLPRPGCGAGELSWPAVKYELDKILDDRFCSITF